MGTDQGLISRENCWISAGDQEMERLVNSKLNGRQIKNVVSTAHALATMENCRIKLAHLSKALTVSERFMCEFNGAEHVDSVST